jgi:segregation and condensation protein A
MDFQVELDIYRGPLDLLLYLVRKHELEVTDIPVAAVTDQFLKYVAVLEELDVNAAADFLDLASTLIEIKSRLLLPHEEEIAIEAEDSRPELVQRLLEFKRFRDAAALLDERSRQWQERYPRHAADVIDLRINPADQPIHGVELWDLVSALARVLRERANQHDPLATVVYDETPVHVFMERIYVRIVAEHRLEFSRLFTEATHRSTLVGMFLAVLELMRHRHVKASQGAPFGEIWMELGEQPLSIQNERFAALAATSATE